MNVLDSAGLPELAACDFLFVDDNCPVHRSSVVDGYKETIGIETLKWPPYSPDLNLIETVGGCMKKRMLRLTITRDLLDETVQNAWNSLTTIPMNFVQKLYRSFGTRLNLCRRANGRPIPY